MVALLPGCQQRLPSKCCELYAPKPIAKPQRTWSAIAPYLHQASAEWTGNPVMDMEVNHWSPVFESLLLEAEMSKEQPLFYGIVDPHANHPPITIVSKERRGQLESVLGSHRIVSGALPPHPACFKQGLQSWNQTSIRSIHHFENAQRNSAFSNSA